MVVNSPLVSLGLFSWWFFDQFDPMGFTIIKLTIWEKICKRNFFLLHGRAANLSFFLFGRLVAEKKWGPLSLLYMPRCLFSDDLLKLSGDLSGGEFGGVKFISLEQWKNPSCLGYIGDYTTRLYGDYMGISVCLRWFFQHHLGNMFVNFFQASNKQI